MRVGVQACTASRKTASRTSGRRALAVTRSTGRPSNCSRSLFTSRNPKSPTGRATVNEEIDVAVDSVLAPRRRSAESKGSDAKPGQIRSVPCQLRQYCLALVHGESIAVLNCLAVKPGNELSWRMAEAAQLGWQTVGSVFRRSNCESQRRYTDTRHDDGNRGWLPVLDKLRTLNEIDPETVELLTL